MSTLKLSPPMISFHYFQSYCQNCIIICKKTACLQYFVWAILQNWMRAIEKAQNLLNQLSIGDSALGFISRPPKWLDCERYLHRQQPYGMQYCLHEILCMDNITELNESYPTSTKSPKSVMNWWLCTEIHIPPPKVIGLWEISSLPATIRHAVLPTWNTFYWQYPPPKVVGLWEISSPPATIRHAILPTWNTFYGQYYRAEWERPTSTKSLK